ncbi:hypothetical protein QSU92_01170 [Microbacterium sp. ET2]|nr:hypothetical protein [Microbacterium sp. ET2 (Ac-2212)]WJL95867.1 hypothetical protein QSU92_01170 [Microbacterium sp. ET2 (Ac-2212)]
MNPHLDEAIQRIQQAQDNGGQGSEASATLLFALAVVAVATELKLSREAA